MLSASEFSYDDRYGKSSRKSWVIPAVFFAVLGVVWIIWAGLFHSVPEIRPTLYSFSITGEKEISLHYGIDRKDPSEDVICTLIAYDIDKNVIGQIDDLFSAGQQRIQRTTAIPTRTSPVSAAVSRCRIK